MSIIDLRPKQLPSGTRTLFQQNTTPIGWTRETNITFDNSALRIVNGSVSTGGVNEFTNVMNSTVTTTGGGVHFHALSINEMPWHNHGGFVHTHSSVSIRFNRLNGNSHMPGNPPTDFVVHNASVGVTGDLYKGTSWADSPYQGSSWGHSHGFTNPSFNLNIAYIDCIIGVKD